MIKISTSMHYSSLRGPPPNPHLPLRLHHDHDQQTAEQKEKDQKPAGTERGSRRALLREVIPWASCERETIRVINSAIGAGYCSIK
jgi:hypothetical protein